MMYFRFLSASMMLAALSFSTICRANPGTAAPEPQTDARPCAVSADPSLAPASTSGKPPALTVGVTDPGTTLILPWFLTDIVNAVNTHQSGRSFVRALRSGI